jgi:hypothetical protein
MVGEDDVNRESGGVVPGWYLDPTALRWWDGAGWTDLTRDVSDSAFAGPVSTVRTGPVPGWHDDPLRQRWWNGTQWTDAIRYSTSVDDSSSSDPEPERVEDASVSLTIPDAPPSIEPATPHPAPAMAATDLGVSRQKSRRIWKPSTKVALASLGTAVAAVLSFAVFVDRSDGSESSSSTATTIVAPSTTTSTTTAPTTTLMVLSPHPRRPRR